MIQVKIILTISVDPKEYPVPSDGNVGAEIYDYIKDIIHEVEGFKLVSMKIDIKEKWVNNYLPTDYQNFIALSRYARWKDDEQRRETWKETVKRYFDFFEEHRAYRFT